MKVIEYSQIESETGVSIEDILRQCQTEFTQAKNVVQQKRFVFRDRLRQYSNQIKKGDAVSINLAYSNINAMLATEQADTLRVSFIDRDPSDVMQADMWTKIAEFDYQEMWMEEINYEKSWDKFFYGVWIRQFVWRDDYNNTAIVKATDPMTWIPDPKWWKTAEMFRFMWFQTMMEWDEMKTQWFYEEEIEKFVKLYDSEFYMYDPYNLLPQNREQSNNEDIRYRYVYQHYTIINWKKYQVSTDYWFQTMWRLIPIDAVLWYEKADTSNILRPVTLSYYRPQRHNPYWVSLMDLVEDKQKAISKLANLGIKRATRNALWWHRLYNKDKITNRNDLANLTEDPKLIGISLLPNESLTNVMTEVPTMPVPQDSFEVNDMLNYYIRFATGIDPLTMWLQSPWSMTATEAQQIQQNANLLLWYTKQIDLWSEKDFWRKWFKMYKRYFKWKKIIRLLNPLGTNTIILEKWDLNTKEDPDVIIKSRWEVETENNKSRGLLTAVLPFIQQTAGQKLPFAFVQALRDMVRYAGLSDDKAKLYVPETPEEIEAKQQLELLNRNVNLDQWSFEDTSKDWDTYLSIYRQAIDTPAKRTAIQLALNSKIAKNKQMDAQAQQMWQQQNGQSWLMNQASSQLVNQAMTKEKGVQSTQDVL